MLPAGVGGRRLQETISLYLDLKKGEKADFEVVGRAAAAFAELVKEIAFVVEPGIEVRLEFESGTEGSLSLNAILKELKTPAGRRAAMIGIVAAVATTFVQNAVSYGYQRLFDELFPKEEGVHLAQEDIERIVRAMKAVDEGKIAKEPAREVYKQLERDSRIKSVGTVTEKIGKPIQPVPRTDFPTRAGIVQPVETSPKSRKARSRERMVLISPVLLSADRMWRFRSLSGEAGYHMKDEKFLSGLLSGRRKLPMAEGIQITAEIETHEKFEGGVWVPVERFVTRVVTVHRPAKQLDLFAPAPKPKRRKKK
jgi:hypothetical protein